MTEKEKIRSKFIAVRDGLENREEKSLIISKKVLENDQFIQSQNILLYIPVGSEVDITPIIKFCFKNNKNVFIPFIDELKYGKINEMSELVTYEANQEFRIPPRVSIDLLDLVIVPGVVFDEEGYRLGSGKGWYDRFLKENEVYSIGVTFKECTITNLPKEDYDIPVDQLVTD